MDKEAKQMFELIIDKLGEVGKRLDNVDTRLDIMNKRQDEIYSIVRSIEDSNNTHKAEKV